MKQEIGKQIETLRKELGVSTYELEKKGIHPSLPATIEKGQKGDSMDSLIKYLNAIDKDIFLSVGKKENKEDNCTHKNLTHIGEIDEWYCKSCFNLVYWDKENNKYKL